MSRVYEGPGALFLDLVGFTYVGRVKELVACGGVYVQSPEDSIVSSLNACVYWDSPADCERAAAVLAAQWTVLDWNYLYDKASREGVVKKLEALRDKVKKFYA
ncbi:MAG: hypothetical protein ABWK05_00785 [Pyrobaculum sp.]